ncbi:carboxypeptidase-like regulatory domain-containing protein [Thermococcus sp. Bubb.Bath]|uniref:carboxypeptidase-like regulatory domain-containing protein n=1 Tax=Thermococcus sp. Bubb.Bath TaxID=1638242 RepID=UPI00197D75EC|nr:carboxypeptidase-like regulatory domain-containing protein [Thermococcus sp. Bubb.Bath]
MTFNVIATYNGHQVGSDTYTVTPQDWSADFEYYFDRDPVYAWIDNGVDVQAYSEPGVPVNVTVTQNGAVLAADENEVHVPIPAQAPGTVTYNVTLTYRGHVVGGGEITFDVQSWSLYFSTYPELEQGKTVNFTVHVTTTRQWWDSDPVTVKLVLPDNTVKTGEGFISGVGDNQEGTVVIENVTPSQSGVAKVIVVDELSGKEFTQLVPVYPAEHRIDVSVKTSGTVYRFLDNSMNVSIDYHYAVSGHANVTILNSDGNVIYSGIVSVVDGYATIDNIDFTAADMGNILVEVKSIENPEWTGYATVPVEDWQVNFNWNVPSEAYQYVPTSGSVSVSTVPSEQVTLVIKENGNVIYNSTSNAASFTIPTDSTGNVTYTACIFYNGHKIAMESKTLTVLPWNVTITPSRTWAYKYVPTEINFTVKPNVTAVNPHDLVVKVDGNVTDSINVELTGNETHTVEVYYNGHLIKSQTFTITMKNWHVNLTWSLASGRGYLYQYVPEEVTIQAIPVNASGDRLPFNITLNITYIDQNLSVINVAGTNSVTIPVEDDTPGAGVDIFVDAYYGTHPMVTLEDIHIPTHTWSIDVVPEVVSSAYTSSGYLWAGVPADVVFKVVTYDNVTGEQVSLPLNIPITVTYDGNNYIGNNTVTVAVDNPMLPSESFYVTAAYQDISYAGVNPITVPVKDWGVYVNAYPGKLYKNLPQNLTLIVGYSAGINDVATVTVENGNKTNTTQVNIVPVGSNSAIGVVDLGQITPTGDYVKVKVDTGYCKSTLLKIPVINWSIAVIPKVTFVYTNVSTDITVDVHYSDSMLDGQAIVFLQLPNGTVLTQQATITDGQGSATFTGVVSDMAGNITVYAADVASGEMSPEETIPVHDWHMEMSLSPTEWYTYMPQDYTVNVTYIDDVTGGIAKISGTDTVEYNLTGVVGTDAITVTDGQGSITLENLTTENAGNATFAVIDNAHGKSVEENAIIHGWKVVVTYPEKLYAAPGYKNPIQVGFKYIADNNETVPYTGNTTIIIHLPGNITFTANVNASPVDFGTVELNQTGVGNITVYANDYPAISGPVPNNITVENLLTLNVTTKKLYAGVPSTVVAKITYNGGDYHNLNVYIANATGQRLTNLAPCKNGTIWTANVTLPAGNYTVVAYDTVYNVTMTDTFHVAPWHIVVESTKKSIPFGALIPTNVTVYAIDDETNSVAMINGTVQLTPLFSNTTIVPSEVYGVKGVRMVNGVAMLENLKLFAPIIGNYTITATLYGKSNTTIVDVVPPQGFTGLTYVYVKNVFYEGTTRVPNETVALYWSIDGSVYFPVYSYEISNSGIPTNPRLVTFNPTENELTVLSIPVVKSLSLYMIAVPESIAKDHLAITEHVVKNLTGTWTSPVKVSYDYNVTVNGTTINVLANVSKTIRTTTSSYRLPAPGVYVIPSSPATLTLWAVPFTPYIVNTTEETISAENSTSYTFTFTPTKYIELTKLTDMSIQPAQNGKYFEFEARLYMKYLNISGQFDEQFQTFEQNVQSMVDSLPYLSENDKEALAQEIIADAQGYKSNITGAYSSSPTPISGEEVQFHIDNPAIAYLEPANGTTDENGTVTFRVYSAAPAGATPDKLINYMGDVTVWATYDNMTTESYTVSFGGVGSISGDVVGPNNNLLPGAVVELQKKEGNEWVTATDYAGNELKTTADGKGHYSFGNVPATLNGTEYRVVATYGDGTGYADTVVYPFKTSTADVVVTSQVKPTGLAAFVSDAHTHNVKIVTGNNPLHTADYQAMSFLMTLIGVQPAYTDNEINISTLTANDMIIAVGGPLVNSITAYYQNFGEAKMVTNDNGSISIVVGNETVANWTAPTPWWNVTEGYWIIQKVVDPNTNATIYMIYGTDADSTWAASYYFSQHFAELQGKNYVVGYWKDTDHMIYSPAFLKFSSEDTTGFSPTDDIGVVVEG